MSITHDPQEAIPGTDPLTFGDGPTLRRILVPVRCAQDASEALAVGARMCRSASGLLRVVHVRIYDKPMRGAGRFYPETPAEAAALPDEALPIVWAYGVHATTAVVEAPRGEVGAAIARAASVWGADVIVMTRRPSPAICRVLSGSVPDQVMRKASCPVLAVRPKPKKG